MVTALRSFFYMVIGRPSFGIGRAGGDGSDNYAIGAYPADYSEPTQAEIDAANASCAELFKEGDWVSVNRKS